MASSASTAQNGHAEPNGTGLAHEHAAHNPTIEEVVDEAELYHSEEPKSASVLETPADEAAPGWVPPASAKSAGKQKQELPVHPKLDPSSETLFPSLGKPTQQPFVSTWGANKPKSSGSSTPNGTNGTSKPSAPIRLDPRKLNIPNQVTEDFPLRKNQILPRQELKKPLADILKDMNRKSTKKVTVSHSMNHATQETIFTISGPSRDAVAKAWGDVVSQVGARITEKVSIPQSARAHIIGKGGLKIKEIQEKTGARITIPKMEDSPRPTAEDDDPIIEILVEGNAFSVGTAQQEILKIAKDKTPDITSTIRSIPAELYPFLSERKDKFQAGQNVDVRVPSFSQWKSQAPPQRAQDLQPAAADNHISLRGERLAVQAMKAEIEKYAAELRERIEIDQFNIDQSRHRFIIGKLGMTPEAFLSETGCAIILPEGEDDEITIIGPPKLIQAAKKKAQAQHVSMQAGKCDLHKVSKTTKDSPYAKNLTAYLRQRKAVEQLEADFKAHIVTSGEVPWEIFARDYEEISAASTELTRIIRAHPPARMASVTVDPFYHPYLQKDITPRVRSDFGVHIVVPAGSDGPVVLVFEGVEDVDSDFRVSREQPGQEELRAYQQKLRDTEQHILQLISSQAAIVSEKVEVPTIFQEKLKRYIKGEMDADRVAGKIPVRVSAQGTTVTLRGPEPSVKTLLAKVNAFVAEAIEDEKERGFTLSFDFPQKHANQLIGKGGSFIRELRDKFDVEIQVEDGKVELKGPKAKAEKARAHITTLGRQWADETTHVLQIDQKFHSELIGQSGTQINKLQNKYKVQIFFPRSGRSTKDEQTSGDAGSESGKKGGRRDQSPNEVIVKGPKKGADDARGELLDLVQYLKDNSYTATVSVQQSQVPSLIGQGGKTMDELRATSGAKIDVPNSKDAKDASGNVEIQIKGTKSQVAQAKKLIEEKKEIFDHIVKTSLDVEKKHHKSLVGTRGSKLREIITDAGGSDRDTSIQVPRVDADETAIKIEGNKDVVEKIVAAIIKITADLDSQETDSVDVPTEQHRNLIGRGGETKKQLESKFKVVLEIPRQGSGLTEVKITGLPADVTSAKAHIAQLVKDQEGETIQIPRNLHHTIAENGQFFRALQNRHHVSVNHDRHPVPPKPDAPAASRANNGDLPLITDDDVVDAHSWHVVQVEDAGLEGEIPWVLRGSADNVTKAKIEILKALEQASKNNHRGFLVLSDPSKYRYVIGTKGATVKNIRDETGCKINVPQQDTKDESIEILGTKEGVEKAKNLILEAASGAKNVAKRA